MRERLRRLPFYPNIPHIPRSPFIKVGAAIILAGGGFLGVGTLKDAPKVLENAVSIVNGTTHVPEVIVIDQAEEKQVQALENFINSSISESFNRLDLNSPAARRGLIDRGRTTLVNGTFWNLEWTLPGSWLPPSGPKKVNIEVMLTTRGGDEVDKYMMNIYGLDGIKGEYFGTKTPVKNLIKVSYELFHLSPTLKWQSKETDGSFVVEAFGNDSFGNRVEYTINSAGVAQLTISR